MLSPAVEVSWCEWADGFLASSFKSFSCTSTLVASRDYTYVFMQPQARKKGCLQAIFFQNVPILWRTSLFVERKTCCWYPIQENGKRDKCDQGENSLTHCSILFQMQTRNLTCNLFYSRSIFIISIWNHLMLPNDFQMFFSWMQFGELNLTLRTDIYCHWIPLKAKIIGKKIK